MAAGWSHLAFGLSLIVQKHVVWVTWQSLLHFQSRNAPRPCGKHLGIFLAGRLPCTPAVLHVLAMLAVLQHTCVVLAFLWFV